MLGTWTVVLTSLAYLGLLFAIATFGDRRAVAGRSIVSNGSVYALSMCVYATSWTYYGSVGRAASSGVGFLPIYLGPTIMAALWWVVLRRIIRISKRERITSLADFVSSRYGKSGLLGGLVSVVAVIGIVPYIALQLKAVSSTFLVLRGQGIVSATPVQDVPMHQDTALYVALLLAAFTILFGTRHLDATERHEGMVAAIAFESIVKLVAFLAVGCFVTFGLFDGFGDLFAQAATQERTAALLAFGDTATGGYASWFWLTVLSMLAILLLPRQWQVSVVENVDERHLRRAIWLFPLYLLLINVFVLPIAVGGLLTFGADGTDADTFVLALPLANAQPALALLVFLGGLSAATGMVIVETIALATMVSNSLVLPLLLRAGGSLPRRADIGSLVLWIRRATIVLLLLLGFGYFRVAGEAPALVSIGLVSFAAVAQFAPALLGGLFWRGATHRGAVAGISLGILVWGYTLLLPSFAASGWLPASLLTDGPFGIGVLAPQRLFGLTGLDEVSHSMLWSMLANIGAFVGLSLTGRPSSAESVQAHAFVDVMSAVPADGGPRFWRGSATHEDLRDLLVRFLGPERAAAAFPAYDTGTAAEASRPAGATPELVHQVETLLGGAVGAASARVLVASVVDVEPPRVDEVMEILDETSQVLAHSRALERKSAQLEAATTELRAANERLQDVDRLKDDFVSTVSHELRTPLTSIRAFSEILLDNPDLDEGERQEYLQIIVDQTERLTRLVNQVLDLAKLESGSADWHLEQVDLREVVTRAAHASTQLFRDKQVDLDVDLPAAAPTVNADKDRVEQVLLNLLSNAVKFCEPVNGKVRVRLHVEQAALRVDVTDNGPGISVADQSVIFERFRQGGDSRERPPGTGLGLPISTQIVEHLGGRLRVSSEPGHGATFSFTLPRESLPAGDDASDVADTAHAGNESGTGTER